MRLVSMTDFVLEQKGDNLKYAQFLKQPLNSGMFVPCDIEGNVLEEPKRISYSYNPIINEMHDNKVIRYKQAKERVLFEGFEVKGDSIVYDGQYLLLVDKLRDVNIEFLYFCGGDNIELTKSAKNQLGL